MHVSLTVSVNEAARIVGLSRTAFYHWCKRHGVNSVRGSGKARPRYQRTDIERAAIGNVPAYSSEPADINSQEWTAWVEEMQRLARKAADDAESAHVKQTRALIALSQSQSQFSSSLANGLPLGRTTPPLKDGNASDP